MKKVLSIVLALALVFGFAGMTFAMGPSGADAATVGLVLTSFKVSDTLLSPLMIQNWGGTLQATKTYAEGQPIWFVASYVQNKWVNGDDRNFTDTTALGVSGINSLTTVFTSKDECVNYSYSGGYMNFVQIDGLAVIGGTVSGVPGNISATAKQLEVTFDAVYNAAGTVPAWLQVDASHAVNVPAAGVAATPAFNYYLQIMAFTNACTEAQGTAIAKMPIDTNEFASMPAITYNGVNRNSPLLNAPSDALNLYDANGVIVYKVAKRTLANDAKNLADMANIGAKAGDNVYMVYDSTGAQIIGFVSSGSSYRGMVRLIAQVAPWLDENFETVQYTSDSGGKYVFSSNNAAAAPTRAGTEAVTKTDLEAVMTFFGFSFANSYPVLDKHFEAFAGYWKILEAKYNVAAAVINVPDPGVDIVPKTGDASTAFGMIMVAIAGLAAVGFVMMKRVRG